ncbi:MAG: hypothetical protein EPO21_14950 [Chloroflexota bacterium]|nr:MAG: hypothetical protein EPO21_14950 [Chloroflexota bacterium]
MRAFGVGLLLVALTFPIVLVLPSVASADGRVSLRITMDPAFPVIGQEVRLTALAKDQHGRPITKAQVVAIAWMDQSDNPGMAEMPDPGASRLTPVRISAVPQGNAGEYAIISTLPMSGRWRIQVWVNSSGASGKTGLELTVLSAPRPEHQVWHYLVLIAGGVLALLVSARLASSMRSNRSSPPQGQGSPTGRLRRLAVVLPYAVPIVGTTAIFVWMVSQEMVSSMQMAAEMRDDVTSAQIEKAKESARGFVGRDIKLAYVHLEEHGYRDIILRSGQDYYFVDIENNMVVSTFSDGITTNPSYSISEDDARRIALDFALRHYPSFHKNNLQPEEAGESSPFTGGHVFKWRQTIDGVPTPNAVKVITDRMGRVAIYSARDVKVTVPTTPTIPRERALEIARQQVDYMATRETIALDIGPELTGRQLLRWTVRLDGEGGAAPTTGKRAEIVVDAITGEVISIMEIS